jgi:hypothetical protein
MGRAHWRQTLGITLVLAAMAVSPCLGQQQQAMGPPEPRTLKERLGAKWSDDQRVDNCKVPLNKRGPQPRPDTCPNLPPAAAKRP